MNRDLDIVRIRIYAVAPATTPPYRWTGQDGFVRVTDNILRLTSRNGLEGWSSNTSNVPEGATGEPPAAPDRWLAERLADIAPQILAASALEREAVTGRLLRSCDDPRRRAESLIDIALWDLAARAAGVPLWRYLGGARADIPAYASTPVFEAIEDYVAFVGELAGRGYGAVKLHTRCDPDWDLAMVDAVHAAHGRRIRFMLDVEQRYDLETAVRVGTRLSELDFVWFEAPLPDPDLKGYASLRRQVKVAILPAGNTLVRPEEFVAGLGAGAWSHLRTGPTHAGGVGAAARAMALAQAHGTTVELQSYGFEGRKLAALHLALGLGGCNWFEEPVPETDYEFELAAPLRPDADGLMRPPEGSGLGPLPDWERIGDEAFFTADCD